MSILEDRYDNYVRAMIDLGLPYVTFDEPGTSLRNLRRMAEPMSRKQ
jgi:hypothetical protein